MTLGKIKKRFPNFIHTLEKPPSLRSTFALQRKVIDFQIENINRYYKQQRNSVNGDILIYFGKKNIAARPYNFNIVLSSDRSKIKFGSSTNSYDLTLSINIALENDWKAATLTNSSPDFLKRMMKAAYEKDPELLFFIQSDTPNQLSYANLKEIKSPLSINELKTALSKQLVSKTDVAAVQKDLTYLLRRDKHNLSRQGYANALDAGFTCAELKKKKPNELRQFYSANTFDNPRKTDSSKEKETVLQSQNQEREACLDAIKSNTDVLSNECGQTALPNDLPHRNYYKPQ